MVAYCLLEAGHDLLIITGEVEAGLPPFQLPWYFGTNTSTTALPGSVLVNILAAKGISNGIPNSAKYNSVPGVF